MKLRFVHLSDIHFSNRTASIGFDPDSAMRQAVLDDIRVMRGRLGDSNAILVTGDIAFAGHRLEYNEAANWLADICEAAGCRPESVLLCPGNHDVDQDVIKANSLIQDGHDAVRRGADFYAKNKALIDRLVQPQAKALFYSPMAAFNDFAARYQCSFFADNQSFVWERDFQLNDSSILRIRGLNTALLSGLADVQGSMFLGDRAWTFPKQVGVEYLVMAHHPPRWLGDEDEADRAFNASTKIQLFGHEHDLRVIPGRDWIRMYAGAINPHRAEPNWCPGYNIVEVSVETGESRVLNIDVHARTWQGTPPQFRSVEDVQEKKTFNVKIPLANLPETFHRTSSATPLPPAESTNREPHEEPAEMDPDLRFRSAVYRFFKLTLSKKNEVVGHLRLAEEEDSELTDVERFKLALARARERDMMSDLDAILTTMEKD